MLKVLFQNRQDAFTNWGGDTTQMEKTKEYLTRADVMVTVDLDAAPDFASSDYDLVHIFNIQNADHGIQQLRNAKRKGKPVVVSTIYWDMNNLARRSAFRLLLNRVHDVIPYSYLSWFPGYSSSSMGRRKYRYMQMKQMLLEADLLLPNSYAEAELLATHFNAPCLRAKVVVVPNGVDDEVVSAGGGRMLPQGGGLAEVLPKPFVLQVGRLEPIKGQLQVIEALMEYPEIPLVFLGKGSDEAYVQRCKALGERRGNTYFPGAVPPDQVEGFYRQAKVHVLPSLRESPGLATLEAAVFGANCVVSFHGPVAEYFGGDVWYCDPDQLSSVREGVLNAWRAPGNESLRQTILEKFTWREASRVTREGYRRLTSEASIHSAPKVGK